MFVWALIHFNVLCGIELHNKLRDEPKRYFIYDFALSMSAYFTCGGAIITGLTDYLELSLPLSSAILSIPTILLIMQLFGGHVYTFAKRRHLFLRLFNLGWRLLVPLVFFSVLLPKPLGGYVMVGSYILMTGIYQFVTPAHNAWLVDCTEGQVSEDFYPVRELTFISLFTALMFVYGVFVQIGIKADWRMGSFSLIGVCELLLLCASAFMLLKRMEPPPPPPADRPKVSLFRALSGVCADKRYRSFLLFNIFWNISGVFIPNFLAIYQIRILKLDYIFVVLCTTLGNVCRTLAVPLFAKVARRLGWKKTALIALSITCISALVCPLITRENSLFLSPIAAILNSVPYAGIGISFFRMQIHNSPASQRSTYFAVNAAICGFAAFLGSMLCSSITAFLEGTFTAPPFWVMFLIGLVFVGLTILFIRVTPFERD